MSTAKTRVILMTCPECTRAVRRLDIRAGRCPACSTKICIPKAYYRPIQILGVVVTIVFIVRTFSIFFTSPASFPLVMLWFVLILVVLYCSLWLGLFVSCRMFPPTLKRLHANDAITVLRLDE